MHFETLKKSHLKRNIIIGVVVVSIISAVILNFTRAKYRVTQSIPLVNGTINYKPYDFKVISMYQKKENGSYEEIEEMPNNGYIINEEKSYCTIDGINKDNNAKLYTNEDGEHVIAGLNKNSKCYLYFDESTLIIDLIEKKYSQNLEMFAYDNTVDNNLRYIGSNPDNYLYFNCNDYENQNSNTCELWRIIGIFNEGSHGITNTKLIKIIRNESLGNIAWDENNQNNWSKSTLNEILNRDYYYSLNNYSTNGINEQTRNLIVEIKWKLGASNSNNDVTAETFYTRERGTTVYNGNDNIWNDRIGLLYPSDYGYATSGGITTDRNACLEKEIYNWTSSEYSDCYNNNWLFTSSNEWTLTTRSGNNYNVFYIANTGNINSSYNDANNKFKIRPVLYLKSNLKVKGGNGTSTNPYIIN